MTFRNGIYIILYLHLIMPMTDGCVYEGCFCRNTYIDCKYKNLAFMPRLLSGNCSLCTVDISDNAITEIQDGQLPEGLRAVKCRWNPLGQLSDHAFRDSADTLEELDITSGNLTAIPAALGDLHKLNYLSITGHRLDVATPSNTTAVPNLADTQKPQDYLPVTLRWVFIDNNQLSSIPHTITSLPLLQQLDVSGNRITSIDDVVFPSHITTLNLNRNQISAINKLRFTNNTFSRMVTLELRDNPIKTIVDHVFDQLTSLRILDLAGTKLMTLPLALLPLNSVGAIAMSNNANLTCTCDAVPLRHLRFNGDCLYFFKVDQSRKERISDFFGRDVDRCPTTTAITPSSASAITTTSSDAVSSGTTTAYTCHGTNVVPDEYFDALDSGAREWRLVFRGLAANNRSLYDAYVTPQPAVNNDCRKVSGLGCCSEHYRNNPVLDAWARVEQVALVVYKGGKRVAHVVFDAKGSNATNWMRNDKVVNSSWTDIATAGVVGPYFSLAGDVTESRRFLMSHGHVDCDTDAGWFVAVDHTDNTSCSWEANHGFPMLFFARGATGVNWRHGTAQRAGFMAVFIKEAADVVG